MSNEHDLINLYLSKDLAKLSEPKVDKNGNEYQFLNCVFMPGTQIGDTDLGWYRLTTFARPYHADDMADPAVKRIKVELDPSQPVKLTHWENGATQTIEVDPKDLVSAVESQQKEFKETYTTLVFPKSLSKLSEPKVDKNGKEYQFINCKLSPNTIIDGQDLAWYRLSQIASKRVIDDFNNESVKSIKITVKRSEEIKLTYWDRDTNSTLEMLTTGDKLSKAINEKITNTYKPDSLDEKKVGTSQLKKQASDTQSIRPTQAPTNTNTHTLSH